MTRIYIGIGVVVVSSIAVSFNHALEEQRDDAKQAPTRAAEWLAGREFIAIHCNGGGFCDVVTPHPTPPFRLDCTSDLHGCKLVTPE